MPQGEQDMPDSMGSVPGHLPDVTNTQALASARQGLASPAAEKSWIDSTLIMSLRNGGGRGQRGLDTTASLNQGVMKNSMFSHIPDRSYFLSNFLIFILKSDEESDTFIFKSDEESDILKSNEDRSYFLFG